MIQNNPIGRNHYEQKKHGQKELPFVVYRSLVPQGFSSYPMHWHEEMELIYVDKGSMLLTVDGETYEAKAEDLFLISPLRLHSMEEVKGEKAVYYNVLFHPSWLQHEGAEEDMEKLLWSPLKKGEGSFLVRPKLSQDKEEKAKQLMKELIALGSKKEEKGMSFLIKGTLFALLYYVQEAFVKAKAPKKNLAQMATMKALSAYLQDTLGESISLEDAAAFTGYSTSYFTKFFKNYTGVSFVTYRNLLRLEKAKVLLAEGEQTGLAIAESLGFENYSYFIRTFKRTYEITPKQYQLFATGRKMALYSSETYE